MKIVVTGADGYIGQGIVRELAGSGHRVIAVGLADNPSEAMRGVLYVRRDVFSIDDDEMRRIAPDAVIHLAWRNGFKHGSDSHIDDISKHYRFVASCVHAKVPRLAVMGTMHEVGYHEGAVRADTPCNPTTPYAIAKNTLRQLSNYLCADSETSLIWMRGYYLVSADGKGDSIFAKIVRAAVDGEKRFPFTSGKNQYDFLDYDDFCKLAVREALDSGVQGVVNISSGRPESLSSRVERFIQDNNLNIELEYGAYPDRPYDSPAIWGEREE